MAHLCYLFNLYFWSCVCVCVSTCLRISPTHFLSLRRWKSCPTTFLAVHPSLVCVHLFPMAGCWSVTSTVILCLCLCELAAGQHAVCAAPPAGAATITPLHNVWFSSVLRWGGHAFELHSWQQYSFTIYLQMYEEVQYRFKCRSLTKSDNWKKVLAQLDTWQPLNWPQGISRWIVTMKCCLSFGWSCTFVIFWRWDICR